MGFLKPGNEAKQHTCSPQSHIQTMPFLGTNCHQLEEFTAPGFAMTSISI